MTRAVVALASLVFASAGARAAEPAVTIERATLPWAELQRLMAQGRSDSREAPRRARPDGTGAASITLAVEGTVDAERVRLAVHATIAVLEDRWSVTPLLPGSLAIASGSVRMPNGRQGLLGRGPAGIVFAADGAGEYQVDVEVEGRLEPSGTGRRLRIAPAALTGGTARLELRGGASVSPLTPWRPSRSASGARVVEAALGVNGLDLLLEHAGPATAAGLVLEELYAATVVSLGGTGVTRLTMQAAGGDRDELALELPKGARLWKIWSGSRALDVRGLARDGRVVLPLAGRAQIEVAYTFETAPLGIRGRYRIELPRFAVAVNEAHWDVWMPEGLQYRATQASMAPAACLDTAPDAQTALVPQGACRGFARAVLQTGWAYVEGEFAQAL